MPDLERLHADAEEAEIRGEMARSQLLAAKATASERRIRWSSGHFRRLEAARCAGVLQGSAPPHSSQPV